MKRAFALNGRLRSILAFSFLSGYILSFAFEGQILYSLLELHGVAASGYIMLAVTAQFFGLFTCGLYTKSAQQAKTVMFFGLGTSLISSVPFFFPPSVLWGVGLAVGGYASGASLAAWGYFLKAFTPKQERLRTCADVLIGSNVIMVALNVLSTKLSPQLGLAVVIFGLLLGMASVWTLNLQPVKQKGDASRARAKDSLRNGVLLLCLFVAVLTINSGLMYHVIQPAFEHLGELTVWYWPVPYIAALVVLRNLPSKIKHSRMLYAGMAGTVLAFLGFMFLGRDTLSYLIVDTLFLAACGVFDLFWWSILGSLLDYTEKSSLIFGIGLSANVLGVLGGGLIGLWAAQHSWTAEVTVLSLTVICTTLAILPLLNHRLGLLLKTHAYLTAYKGAEEDVHTAAGYQIEALDPLTAREQEVLEMILSGKSNREIAAELHITENTVKTHAQSIYSKYDVRGRAKLISLLLKGEAF